jgi:hypothetical protein
MIQVVTSSYSDPVLMRDAEEMGAIFVQKPFTPLGLIALLRNIGALPSADATTTTGHGEAMRQVSWR